MFPETILRTKLFSLPLQRNRAARPWLPSKLADTLCPEIRLTLIWAPAGFGKTTLMVVVLKQIGLSVAWLSLDEADNAPPRFLPCLAAAFQFAME